MNGIIVYPLWHVYVRESGEEEQKLIGIYSTRANAEAAIERLKDKPGFKDYPQCFEIFEHTLDRDGWTEGFFTC
jgi:hypothetical protein